MTLAWMAMLALGTVRFEAGPGCGDERQFEGLVREDWELALGPQGAGWRLELSRDGARALVRDLPAAENCKALAQAVAFMVERYFREVAAGRIVAPAPRPRPPGAIVVQPNVGVAEPNVVALPDIAVQPNVVERPGLVVVRPNVVMQREAAVEPRREATVEPEVAPPPPGVPPPPFTAPPMVAVAPRSEPAPSEPPRVEPNRTEPKRTEPARVEPPQEKPVRAEPTRVSAAPVREVQTSEPPPSRGRPLIRAIDVSAGAGALISSDTAAFFTAHAALKLGSRFRVGLLGGLATSSVQDIAVIDVLGGVRSGTLQTTPFVVAAEGGACTDFFIELCASGFAGIRGARGVTSSVNRLIPATDAYLLEPDLGVLARAQWRPWRGFFLALEIWGAFPVNNDGFKVDSFVVARLPTFDFTGSLQVGWSFQIL
jgi:hypothetical protein